MHTKERCYFSLRLPGGVHLQDESDLFPADLGVDARRERVGVGRRERVDRFVILHHVNSIENWLRETGLLGRPFLGLVADLPLGRRPASCRT